MYCSNYSKSIRTQRFAWRVFLLTIIALTASAFAHAQSTITVSSLADDGGAGELRAAINQANSDADGDTITFQSGLSGTITLTSALPQITTGMTIQGNTTPVVAVDGATNYRVFDVNAPGASVSISGLTIQNGWVEGYGAGLYNIAGSVTIANCTLLLNEAINRGGGIDNQDTVTLTNCTLSLNASGGAGGGIANYGTGTLTNCTLSVNSTENGGGILSTGTLTLTNCALNDNDADYGGGIKNYGGTATLTNCTLSGNVGAEYGGAMYSAAPGEASLTSCLVSGNGASYGGGIDVASGTATLTDCALSGNSADKGGALIGGGGTTLADCAIVGNEALQDGGGIESDAVVLNDSIVANNSAGENGGGVSGPITMSGCTVSGNAANNGGGLYLTGTPSILSNCTLLGNISYTDGGGISGDATLSSCTITGNTAQSDAGGVYASATTLTSCILYGDSALTDNEIASTAAGSATYCDIQGGVGSTPLTDDGGNINASPFFDPNGLQNNGGFAPTIAIQPTSQCFGTGDPTGAPATDERGVARPNPPSIGAYDGPPLPLIPAPTIYPPGGATTSPAGIQVTLADSLPGASIYYTLDGSSPTQASTLYTGPFYITSTSILRALAAAPGYASGSPVELVGGSGPDSVRSAVLPEDASPDSSTVSGVASADFTIGTADLHTYSAGLAMISAPYDYSAQTFSSIFDHPNEALAVWNPVQNEYLLGAAATGGTLSPGVGYWVDFSQPTGLRDVGVPTDPGQSTGISLSSGWNMIGGPAYPTLLSACTVTSASTGQSVSFAGAVSNGWVGATLYTLQAGDSTYEAGPSILPGAPQSLLPHDAYWLYASAPCTLVVPPAGTSQSVNVTASQGAPVSAPITDGATTLTIPANALAQDTTITLTTGVLIPSLVATFVTPVGGGTIQDVPVTGATVIGTGVDLEPTGLTFNPGYEATLQIPVNPAAVPAGSVVAIASVDSGSSATAVSQSTLNDFVLSGGIPHFSTWCAIAMNPYWGIYTSGSTYVAVDFGGNVGVSLTGSSGPITILGSVDPGTGVVAGSGGGETMTGQFTQAGTGASLKLTGSITLSGATNETLNLTDGIEPLQTIIYSSTAHS